MELSLKYVTHLKTLRNLVSNLGAVYQIEEINKLKKSKVALHDPRIGGVIQSPKWKVYSCHMNMMSAQIADGTRSRRSSGIF
jgi:hypothetical protein